MVSRTRSVKMNLPQLTVFFTVIVYISTEVSGYIKITLFYETYCPYSIKFVRKQLYPTNKELSDHISLDLVPFGKAQYEKSNDTWIFKCQHGEKECYGNKIHACALEQWKVKGQDQLMELLNCLMATDYTDDQLKKCCKFSNFNYDRLKRCMVSLANDLLAEYGKRTKENNPAVKFVPFVMLNDYFNQTLDTQATQNLLETVCKLIPDPTPDACNFSESIYNLHSVKQYH